MIFLKKILLTLFLVLPVGFSNGQTAILPTPWTEQALHAQVPLSEYPRPQARRDQWLCLNGPWEYAGGKGVPNALEPNSPIEFPKTSQKIMVPFSPESFLSGVQREKELNMWYRRTFEIPASWKNKHVLLNFDAVAHNSTLFINNKKVGTHAGSYDAFHFDITPYLVDGVNTVMVAVQDLNDGKTPCGKCGPRGGSYTNFSGIWQTVWLEPVNANHIEAIRLLPDVDNHRLKLFISSSTTGNITAVALSDKMVAGEASSPSGSYFYIPLKNPELWSPDHPFLYDLKIILHNPDGTVADEISSYFGMRNVGLQKLNGIVRPLINGQFVMQLGLLDQGYWPDGLMTAPTDEALKHDIQFAKNAGFNVIRKHMKTEPQRFYYWADKLGLLIWQDMPAIWYQNEDTAIVRKTFRHELKAIIDDHYNSPSVVTWVPFNENWGAFDVKNITNWVKRYDPSRFVNGNTGFNNNPSYQQPYGDPGNGDFVDTHIYVGPYGASAPDSTRAASLGEFGGVGLYEIGHMWPRENGAYDYVPTKSALTDRYVFLIERLEQLMKYKGLSTGIYTQTTDVEDEINGLLTYDRKVEKMDIQRVKEINKLIISESLRMNK